MQRINAWTKALACLLVAVSLSGCAFGTRESTLGYPPVSDSMREAAKQGASAVVAGNTKIFVNSFRDERSDKTVVGTVRNGFGMRTADVVPTNNVADWVAGAVATELRASGYSVEQGRAAEANDPDAVVVSGDVLNVFCDMYLSYTGQVSVLTTVRTGRGEVFTKHYAGEGSAGLAFAATGESYAQSLALALRSALRKFVADLDAKLAGK